MNITYTFDGVDLTTYGVSVSQSFGLLGTPKRKNPEKFEYPDSNGFVVDLSTVVYEARTIKLDCFVEATSVADLKTQYDAFTKSVIAKTACKTLALMVDASTIKSFSAFVDDISDLKYNFANGANVGTFTLTFIEPEPVIA